MRPGFVGSYGLGPGRPAMRADTRENPVGKNGVMTTWNSRFADSIPRLTGIRIGRVHKNSSNTPTSGSHNSLVRTPIRANFISLERGRRELSEDMPHDPF
jgi:hypothetical protein